MTITAASPKLRRDLSPVTVRFLAFAALSPTASVYLYGAGVINIGGAGAVLALVIGGAMTAWLGLMFGELAAAFPRAGGIYPAFVSLLGPGLAFPYILLMITVAVTNTGFALLGLADRPGRRQAQPLRAGGDHRRRLRLVRPCRPPHRHGRPSGVM